LTVLVILWLILPEHLIFLSLSILKPRIWKVWKYILRFCGFLKITISNDVATIELLLFDFGIYRMALVYYKSISFEIKLSSLFQIFVVWLTFYRIIIALLLMVYLRHRKFFRQTQIFIRLSVSRNFIICGSTSAYSKPIF
jgi:hypothetical protein